MSFEVLNKVNKIQTMISQLFYVFYTYLVMKMARTHEIVVKTSLEIFYKIRPLTEITEDARSTSVFLSYWQTSQGQMSNFPALIASKSFDL